MPDKNKWVWPYQIGVADGGITIIKPQPDYGYLHKIAKPVYKIAKPEPSLLKCECGGEKANTTHSDWCPKYRL